MLGTARAELNDADRFSRVVHHDGRSCVIQLPQIDFQFPHHVIVAEAVERLHIVTCCDPVAENEVALAQHLAVNRSRLLRGDDKG